MYDRFIREQSAHLEVREDLRAGDEQIYPPSKFWDRNLLRVSEYAPSGAFVPRNYSDLTPRPYVARALLGPCPIASITLREDGYHLVRDGERATAHASAWDAALELTTEFGLLPSAPHTSI